MLEEEESEESEGLVSFPKREGVIGGGGGSRGARGGAAGGRRGKVELPWQVRRWLQAGAKVEKERGGIEATAELRNSEIERSGVGQGQPAPGPFSLVLSVPGQELWDPTLQRKQAESARMKQQLCRHSRSRISPTARSPRSM